MKTDRNDTGQLTAGALPPARPAPSRGERLSRCRPLLAVAACSAILIPTGCSNAGDASTAASTPPPAASTAGSSPFGTSGSASATSTTGPLSGAVVAQLDDAIQQTMTDASIPGAIVGVWSPQGSYVRAFGVADKQTREPMAADMFMRIGSETKTFVVTAVLQLVEQGKLGLDDPIGNYLSGVPNGDRVTIRHMAEMRSGIATYSAAPEFEAALIGDPYRQFEPEQLVAYAADLPPLFEPGASFNYSNTNTVLLGILVEKLSGQTLPEFLQQNILEPLGMTSTSYPLDAAYPQPHPQGYTVQTGDGREAVSTDWNPSWGGASGAMISTLEDLRIWADALADGELLTPQIQAERLRVQPLSPDTPDIGYGLGVFDVDGWIGHNGGIPGYQSLTIHLPSADTSVVVLLNTDIPASVDGGRTVNDPNNFMGDAITSVLTPDHPYSIPARPAPPPADATGGN